MFYWENHITGKYQLARDMILPIKHKVDWELILHQKQNHINRDNIRSNKHRAEYDYKVWDKVVLTNHNAYKYGTPYKGYFLITQCFTNDTVNLQCGPTNIWYNIRRIHPYKLDTKVKDSDSINMSDDVII